jgi:hypothetical protein
MGEICPETFTQKTMLNKGKAAGYLADRERGGKGLSSPSLQDVSNMLK